MYKQKCSTQFFLSTHTVAAAPSNVSWRQVAPSVIQVEWDQSDEGAEVKGYTVMAVYGGGVVATYLTLKSHVRSATIQRLVNDGREYTVTIVASSEHIPGLVTFTAQLRECQILLCS